jgi:uncharacterized protein (TIGR02145 family)
MEKMKKLKNKENKITINALFFLILTFFFIKNVSSQDVQTAEIIWQTENLNTRVFSNSENILFAKNQEEWTLACKKQKPAWCYYNFDASTEATYGLFYNTYAINDARNLAPEGWLIPTETMLRKQLKYSPDFQSIGKSFISQNKTLLCNSCENYALLNDDGYFVADGICIGMKDKKYLTISPKGIIKIKEYDNWGEGFQIRCVKFNANFVNENAESSISTITLNEKTWMTQNLRTKTFQNGDSILFISNSNDWETVNAKSIPAYCFKDFDSLNQYEHGFYYNYSAILDSRKLAPKGWRLNTKEDWDALQKNYPDTISFVQAILSDNYYPDCNNSSGLNLIPESRVNLYGMFTGVSLIWCPSKDFSTNTFFYSSTSQFLGGTSFSYYQEEYSSGLPVRCIKEE